MKIGIEKKSSTRTSVDRDLDECHVHELQKLIANIVMQFSIADPRVLTEWLDGLFEEIEDAFGGRDQDGQKLSNQEKTDILADADLISILAEVSRREIMLVFDGGMGRMPFSDAVATFIEERLGKTLLY